MVAVCSRVGYSDHCHPIVGYFPCPQPPGVYFGALPGIFRLAFELALFALATWALYDVRLTPLSWILGVVVVIHYIASYDRMVWAIVQVDCAVQPVLGAHRLRRGYTRCVLPAIALVNVASLTRVGGGCSVGRWVVLSNPSCSKSEDVYD